MKAQFRSKTPHTTCWLMVENATDELVADLKAIGWGQGEPPWNGTFVFVKNGTGLFNGWTDDERKTNMSEARAVLVRHGIKAGRVKRMALKDLF